MKIALAALVVVVLITPTAALSMTRSTTTVSVAMTEFKFTLSVKAVPKGKVVFKVKNVGAVGHDFAIAGKKTPIINSGANATLTVVFTKAGTYPYSCLVPGHADAGMKGVLVVK